MKNKMIHYSLLTAAIAVFLFAIVKLSTYYADAHRNKEQLQEARQLYRQTQAKAPPPILSPVNQPRINELSISKDPISVPATASGEPPQPIDRSIQDRFKPLLEINADVIGWLQIADTAIDYPVVQSEDNEYYLTKDLDRKNNVNGSIFMDYRNDIDMRQKHWILYGHNMKNKTMFMPLLHYESRWFFENHSTIEFDTLYDNLKWQVFSAYFTNASDDYLQTEFDSDEQYEAFLLSLQKKSLHKTDMTLSATDTILTLSTCSNTHDDARFVVHARLISAK
ncbi:SrtB family sortase [Cohnella endophytica]|uniref:SrtB family sortase n=1 Tax=Cohnella endophytica TaxID=2419778 RepID=A0A494YCR2_9BACL|nr:class B sortase [Cohnella endophytica]RKP58071.1 SrtB family sortase [Cohnella endophytica]